MATVMVMHWPEVTKEQYEQVRQVGELGRRYARRREVPHGVARQTTDFTYSICGTRRRSSTRFVQNRLAAGVAAAGISSQPKVEFADSLSVFAPNV